jgi:hypothetical protein
MDELLHFENGKVCLTCGNGCDWKSDGWSIAVVSDERKDRGMARSSELAGLRSQRIRAGAADNVIEGPFPRRGQMARPLNMPALQAGLADKPASKVVRQRARGSR